METNAAHDAPSAVRAAHTALPSLAGRRAAITGGTTGIGRAIAMLLAAEGAQVFICGHNPDHLADALRHIEAVGQGAGMTIDLSDPDASDRFLAEAEAAMGGIDIVVANAAVPAGAIADTGEADLRYQIAVDFTAYLLLTRAAAERMVPGGDLLLIGSMSAVSQGGGSSIYVAAKTGIQGFAHALRQELALRDIKVGLIEPGLTGSDMQYPAIPNEEQRALIEADKMIRAEDVAVAAHFMLSQPRRSAVSVIRIESRLTR